VDSKAEYTAQSSTCSQKLKQKQYPFNIQHANKYANEVETNFRPF